MAQEISGMGLQGVGGFLITDIASQREGMAGLGAKAFRFGPCMSAPRVWPGARRVFALSHMPASSRYRDRNLT